MTTSNKADAFQFLAEVRLRLIRSLWVMLGVFVILLYFANQLYSWIAEPLLKLLPQGHLIATQMTSPILVPFKLAFLAALLLSIPFILYQVWGFISPALYANEKRWTWLFLACGTSLFYAGIAFAYFVIFPMLFHFLAGATPAGVELSPDISEYLDFTIKLLLMFGVLFEIPIMMSLLVHFNFVPRTIFVKKRSYAIVGAFILGMLLAPPDVLSQTIIALPIWALYELGIGLSYFSSIAKRIRV